MKPIIKKRKLENENEKGTMPIAAKKKKMKVGKKFGIDSSSKPTAPKKMRLKADNSEPHLPKMKQTSKDKIKVKKPTSTKQAKDADDDSSDSDIEKYLESDAEGSSAEEDSNLKNAASLDDDMDEEEGEDYDMESFKKSLKKLSEKDPEFYKYLEEHDQELLNFQDDDGIDEAEEEDEESQQEEMKLTLPLIASWKESLKEHPNIKVLRRVARSLAVALTEVQNINTSALNFGGVTEFNSLMNLCLRNMVPALYAILKVKPGQNPTKSRHWKAIFALVKRYLRTIHQLLSSVTDPEVIEALVIHINRMVPFCAPLTMISRKIIQSLVKCWHSDKESLRNVAFKTIVKLLQKLPEEFSDHTLKLMYSSFVKHTQFIKPKTLDLITYMRKSLVHLYQRNPKSAYNHAFLYIRQLAIHLRNARNTKQKQSFEAVYNWQFVQSLALWSEVVPACKETCESLIYPLTMIIPGTIELIPAARFLPLRIHLCRMLIRLCGDSGKLMSPVILIWKGFHLLNLKKNTFVAKNSKHDSIKLSCVLKLSKKETADPAYKLAIVKELCKLLLEYALIQSHKMAFPELFIYPIMLMKKFLKTTTYIGYKKPMKQLLDKIQENSEFINQRRRTFKEKWEKDKINQWEEETKAKGTPLMKFYADFITQQQSAQNKEEQKADEDQEESSEKESSDEEEKKSSAVQEPLGDDVVQELTLTDEEEEGGEDGQEESSESDFEVEANDEDSNEDDGHQAQSEQSSEEDDNNEEMAEESSEEDES